MSSQDAASSEAMGNLLWQKRWTHEETFSAAIDTVDSLRKRLGRTSDAGVRTGANAMWDKEDRVAGPEPEDTPGVQLSSSRARTKVRSKTSYTVDLRAPADHQLVVDNELPNSQRVFYRSASMGVGRTRSQGLDRLSEEAAQLAIEEYKKLTDELSEAKIEAGGDPELDDEAWVHTEEGAPELHVGYLSLVGQQCIPSLPSPTRAARKSEAGQQWTPSSPRPTYITRCSEAGQQWTPSSPSPTYVARTPSTKRLSRASSSSGMGIQPTPPKGVNSTHPNIQRLSGPGSFGIRSFRRMNSEPGQAEMGVGVSHDGRARCGAWMSASGCADDMAGSAMGRLATYCGFRSSMPGCGSQEESLDSSFHHDISLSTSIPTSPLTPVESEAQSTGHMLSGMFKNLTKDFTQMVSLAYDENKESASRAGSKTAEAEPPAAASSGAARRPHRTYSKAESEYSQSSNRPDMGRSAMQSDVCRSSSRPAQGRSSVRTDVSRSSSLTRASQSSLPDFAGNSPRVDPNRSSPRSNFTHSSSPRPNLGRSSPRLDLTRPSAKLTCSTSSLDAGSMPVSKRTSASGLPETRLSARPTLNCSTSSLETSSMYDSKRHSVLGQPETPSAHPCSPVGLSFGTRPFGAETILQPSPSHSLIYAPKLQPSPPHQPSPPSLDKASSKSSTAGWSAVQRVVSHSKLNLLKRGQQNAPISPEPSQKQINTPSLSNMPKAGQSRPQQDERAGQGRVGQSTSSLPSCSSTFAVSAWAGGPEAGWVLGGTVSVGGPEADSQSVPAIEIPPSVWGGCLERLQSRT